jgi:hypothetical protein
MNEATELAHGRINGHDSITVQLIRPADMPAIVRIAWPLQATVISPREFSDIAAMVARLFAGASTELARIQAKKCGLR